MAVGINTNLDWETIHKRYERQMSRLGEFVELYESQYGVNITPGAIEVIIIPLVEDLQDGDDIDYSELGPTLQRLFETMARNPHEVDEGRTRSSRSVLKAMFENWCGIPPICRRRPRRENSR